MNVQAYAGHLRRHGEAASLLGRCLIFCLAFIAVAALGARLAAPVSIDFPDFPFDVAAIDLGQSLTINADTQHDGGKGVTWSCAGDACSNIVSTSKWATFHAGGITGTADITATSIKQPSVHKTLRVTVYLNAVPNMLCEETFFTAAKAAV